MERATQQSLDLLRGALRSQLEINARTLIRNHDLLGVGLRAARISNSGTSLAS